MIARRNFFFGVAASLICAPAVVRAASLMPVRIVPTVVQLQHFGFCERLYVAGILPTIMRLQDAGFALEEIAADLNARGSRSMNGDVWDARRVLGVVNRDRRIRDPDAVFRAQKLSARATR
jgi:hypothetical protein